MNQNGELRPETENAINSGLQDWISSKLSKKRRRDPCCAKSRGRVQEKAEAQRGRCCLVACVGVARGELAENNLLAGLCCRSSALYSRPVRLSLFLVGLLLDVSLCALFF